MRLTISKSMYRHITTLAAVVMLTASAFAQSDTRQEPAAIIGLDGYCPVCIVAAGKWEPGSNEITSVYDGITYLFPNQTLKETFEENPAKYVPALNGDCIVCIVSANKRVPGTVNFATIHNDRLFLFPNDETKAAFESDPAKYENADLAADGNCVVCSGGSVKGSTEFTELHDGMRYLFPSAGAAAAFRRSPQQFAVGSQVEATQTVSASATNEDAAGVTVTGTSTCAVCEFGVKPIGNPEELGMAVKTADGHVIVVEQAHVLYPSIYKARYAGQNVQVQGKILKSEGRVSWLNPSSIQVLN